MSVDSSFQPLQGCLKEQRHLILAANVSKLAFDPTTQNGVIKLRAQDLKPTEHCLWGGNITHTIGFTRAISEQQKPVPKTVSIAKQMSQAPVRPGPAGRTITGNAATACLALCNRHPRGSTSSRRVHTGVPSSWRAPSLCRRRS